MDANEGKAAVRDHALALEQEIRRIHTPNVTTGHDTDFVNFIVVGKEIEGGRRDDRRRLVIHIKGEPGHWLYDLEYRHTLARIPADAVILDRDLDQTMVAVNDFLKVEALAA
jgi:hypothetical protein